MKLGRSSRGSRASDKSPSTAEETAAELVDVAWKAPGRRRIHLARKALEIWPDCADAYVLLGRCAGTPEDAYGFFAQGVAAGERALGSDVFHAAAGHFWGLFETRPYMVAREWLAESLWTLGRGEEAVGHFEDMLRLNPNDNQGIRYRLANLLLDLERHDRLSELLDRYKEDDLAEWSYTRALLTFRLEGDSAEALRRLRQALKSNRFVPTYLLGQKASASPGARPLFSRPGRRSRHLCLPRDRALEEDPGRPRPWRPQAFAHAVPFFRNIPVLPRAGVP